MKTMHLFAGAGGGILADLILGHEPTIAVEWDAYCCQVLRERVEDGWFPGMQVWEGDVRLFDPSEYKGKVDCIHAGFPCQDISTAGNQAGVGEGTRSGLYREALRIFDEVQPSYIFLENVSAIATGDNGGMFRTLLGDLAERGFHAIWKCLSAAEVGANHKRDRWWLLAYPSEGRGKWSNGVEADRCSGGQPWNANEGIPEEQREIQPIQKEVADTSSINVQGKLSSIINQEEWEKQGERPLGSCGDVIRWWEAESQVGRVVDGMAYRSHQLAAMGNGQVPLQAATAFSILWKMMEAANE